MHFKDIIFTTVIAVSLYFSKVPFEERVFTVLKWLQLPDDERLVVKAVRSR